MNTREYNIARFEAEMGKIKRPGIDKLMTYIRNSDFYKAPASTKYHLSCEGGLLQHSLNVLDALRSVLIRTPGTWDSWTYQIAGKPLVEIPDESVTIMALLHDICKTYFYGTSTRNAKVKNPNTGKEEWTKVPFYTVEDRMPLGHGDKSAFIIMKYMDLTNPEMYAIWWHMGITDGADPRQFGQAIEKFPIVYALHTADMIASHFMEAEAGNKDGFTLADQIDETGEATMDEHIEAEAQQEQEPEQEREPEYQEAPPIEEAEVKG